MRRRSGLMAVSVMRCSCLNGGWQSPILRQDAAGLEAARILSPSKARALESKAAPGPGAFYRVSGFVLWHKLDPSPGGTFRGGRPRQFGTFLTHQGPSLIAPIEAGGEQTGDPLLVPDLTDWEAPEDRVPDREPTIQLLRRQNRPYCASSSSNDLACFRSSVSKPSVNQP